MSRLGLKSTASAGVAHISLRLPAIPVLWRRKRSLSGNLRVSLDPNPYSDCLVLKKIQHSEGTKQLPRCSSVTKTAEAGCKAMGKKREVHVDLSTLAHITHVGSALETATSCASAFRRKRQNFRVLQRIVV